MRPFLISHTLAEKAGPFPAPRVADDGIEYKPGLATHHDARCLAPWSAGGARRLGLPGRHAGRLLQLQLHADAAGFAAGTGRTFGKEHAFRRHLAAGEYRALHRVGARAGKQRALLGCCREIRPQPRPSGWTRRAVRRRLWCRRSQPRRRRRRTWRASAPARARAAQRLRTGTRRPPPHMPWRACRP